MTAISVSSRRRVEMIDITAEVCRAIEQSGVVSGMAVIFTTHTTASVTINENADPDVARDMIAGLNRLVPHDDGYAHLEGNSDAHIKSSLFGASETLIVDGNTPLLGTWQGIYFCEFDGPRSRKVHVKVIPG